MIDWAGRTVLVTGAGGFIGSHLVEALLATGARVRALVKYNGRGDLGKLHELPAGRQAQLEIRAGDIRDPFFVDEAVAKCDTVFHLAALIGIPYSYHAPADYIATNVTGTLHVLQACRRHGVRRLLQTSTSEVYGSAQTVPMTEAHPLHPQSPYAASKVGADALALSYARSFATPVVVVRPFNTYGPRQSPRAVIPTILSQLLFAEQVELGATAPERDFTYVTDTVAGFLTLASTEGLEGQTLNLGAEQSISVGDLAELCMEVTGIRKPVRVAEQRLRPEASEVDRLLAGTELVRSRTTWRPAVALREGLKRTAEYLATHQPPHTGQYAI